MAMIRKVIKKICFIIYETGRYEKLRLDNIELQKKLKKISKIHNTALISSEAAIYNVSRPNNKLEIGARSRIMGQLLLFDHDGEILIGEDCFVGPDTRIWSAKKISIGNRVLIAHNVNIHDNISHPLNAQERYQEYTNFVKSGIHLATDIKGSEIIIEDDVWIGFNSIILRGVKIGRGAIIGAGSLVTKDIEPWTINVGNPLRCIEKLKPEI